MPREVFEQTARAVPLIPGAAETVVSLRKAGFQVGIITDSFHTASEIVRRRVFADFSFAHLMRFRAGKATGRVTLAPAMAHPKGCKLHKHCKVNFLHHYVEKIGIGSDQVLAVGDGENDICLLQEAGVSAAFRPKSPAVAESAQHVLHGALSEVLSVVLK